MSECFIRLTVLQRLMCGISQWCGPTQRILYSDWTMGWTVRGSNPGGEELFRTHPDSPWGPSASYAVRALSFSEVKRLGRGVNYPSHIAPRLKKSRVITLHALFLNGSYKVKFTCTFTSQKLWSANSYIIPILRSWHAFVNPYRTNVENRVSS